MNGLVICNSEKQTLSAVNNFVSLRSNLDLLSSHNGLRPQKLHLLLGSTGSGKSTMTRTIIIDQLTENPTKNIGIYLSEEDIDSFKVEISKTNYNFHAGSNLFPVSEMELEDQTEQDFIERVGLEITTHELHIFIIDNITTSKFYADKKPREQLELIARIKDIGVHTNCAILLIAHTGALVSDNCQRLINENDIRGSKGVVNLTEFLYIMQRFEIRESFFSTIRIVKHRGQEPQCKMFSLVYSKSLSTYIKTRPIPFKEFKDAYGKRNKL